MARIFLVEDEEDISEMIRIAVESHGHTFRGAVDGREALELLQKEQFDVAIMDIMLPGIDSYSILDELEKNEQQKDLPIIIVTALKPAEKLFNKFKKVKYFLSKPFAVEDLLQKIDSLVNA